MDLLLRSSSCYIHTLVTTLILLATKLIKLDNPLKRLVHIAMEVCGFIINPNRITFPLAT